MGSSSRLVADALMTMCNDLHRSSSWLRVGDGILPFSLHHFVGLVLASLAFVTYKHISDYVRFTWLSSSRFDEPVAEAQDTDLRAEELMPLVESKPDPPGAPFYELAEAVSNTSCPIEGQSPEKSNGNVWDQFPVDHEEVIPSSPLSSPSLSASWPPALNRSISDSTQTDVGSQSPGPLVHVFCTHVEQKISRNGLVSSITRPSYHVPAVHFPQVQTTFAASSERAFFNSQQELSASPIVRDPRYLDLQYRFSASTNPQASREVGFDEIIGTIRRNRKTGRDTTIHVHVVRVKDIVPSVIFSYVYYGRRQRSVVGATSQFGEDVPQCTKIVDFRAHHVRVKHICPDTLLWDCARHVAKSVKHDHDIVLQTRDLVVEILSQDQDSGGIHPSKIDSPEAIKSWVRDILPKLLQKNGNVVHLQVSVFKKA